MKISQGPRIPMKISQHPLKLVRYLLNLIFTNNTLIKSKITNQSIYKPPSSIWPFAHSAMSLATTSALAPSLRWALVWSGNNIVSLSRVPLLWQSASTRVPTATVWVTILGPVALKAAPCLRLVRCLVSPGTGGLSLPGPRQRRSRRSVTVLSVVIRDTMCGPVPSSIHPLTRSPLIHPWSSLGRHVFQTPPTEAFKLLSA